MSKMINMRYPVVLIERIDAFKKDKGFTTRTSAIIYLLQHALNTHGQ